MSAILTPHQFQAAQRKSKYSGLQCFSYSPRGTDLQLECWIEYEGAERGSREHGLQMEPDEPASATLHIVEVNNEDIYEILNASTIDEIETAFLEQHE
jgi:hypothetical protein